MDTLTQITLGAGVGEAVLGRKVGNKAILWGGVAAAIPDLDILAMPFLDSVQRLTSHRGYSHSIAFAILFAPLLAYLTIRIHGRKEATWSEWTKLTFCSIITHPMLDCFTTYGTQLFEPFSEYRVAFNTIFIIDPLYTVPFLLCVIMVMFLRRTSKKRRILNYIGLGLSSLYLIFTVINKFYVNSVFEVSLARQNISYDRYFTTPTPLNNILWSGVFEDENGFWVGHYSLLDSNKDITLGYIKKNDHLIERIRHQRAVDRLIWVSKRYYSITTKGGFNYFNDLRFGQFGGWAQERGKFSFSYKIINEGSRVHIRREHRSLALSSLREPLNQLIERVKGI